jgi:hypothetical protein
VPSSSLELFPDISVSRDLDRGVAFFKDSRTSSNSLELASRARIWRFEEQATLMEDPTQNITFHKHYIIAKLENIMCKNWKKILIWSNDGPLRNKRSRNIDYL